MAISTDIKGSQLKIGSCNHKSFLYFNPYVFQGGHKMSRQMTISVCTYVQRKL